MTDEEFDKRKSNILAFLDTDDANGFIRALSPHIEGYTNFYKKPNSYRDVHKGAGITLTKVGGEGGDEGEGSYVDLVFEVSAVGVPKRYLRVLGSYDSYEGTEWDDTSWHVVEPLHVVNLEYFPPHVCATSRYNPANKQVLIIDPTMDADQLAAQRANLDYFKDQA